MTFLDALDGELTTAGIPARRRRRILTEFSDHLHSDPGADLGAPRDIAREFADELGTRLARGTAYRAFGVLAVSAIVLVVMFFTGGRTWGGWVGYGSHPDSAYMPGWWTPYMVLCFITAQVALAAGGLALLKAWRLRRVAVMTAADARSLNRRAAVGLICGAITMTIVPLTHWVVGAFNSSWNLISLTVGPALILLQLALLPDVLRAARLRPAREGAAGDLSADLGISDPRVTPLRLALALSAVILVVMTLVGARSDDLLDGIARGVVDAAACLTGFFALGGYLGFRAPAPTAATSD